MDFCRKLLDFCRKRWTFVGSGGFNNIFDHGGKKIETMRSLEIEDSAMPELEIEEFDV